MSKLDHLLGAAALYTTSFLAGCGEGQPDPYANTQIAFVSGNIYVMNADGSDVKQLTDNVFSDRFFISPAPPGEWYREADVWSPDGTQIAFMSRRDRNWDIYVINADGTNEKGLTTNRKPNEPDTNPVWSPDGKHLAYVTSSYKPPRIPYDADIYVMNADGSEQRNLTDYIGRDWNPTWSPDGKYIAFERTLRQQKDDGTLDFNDDIIVMDADGSNKTNLTNHPAQDSYPAWSPDGSKIAFVSNRAIENSTSDRLTRVIYLMDPDGRNLTRLTTGCFPSWSPDGSKLSFITGRPGSIPRARINVINADGTNETTLPVPEMDFRSYWDDPERPEYIGTPSWAPDGKRIVYSTNMRYRDWEIYVVNPDGTDLKRLKIKKLKNAHFPIWSPLLKVEEKENE